MKLNDYCVFILTHGRPDRVFTLRSLRKAGFTGRVYLVIDDEDEQADEYFRMYGEQVIQFDKKAIAPTFDEGDTFNDRRAIIYARNACFQIARDLGVKYFIQLDDDYTCFVYKKDPRFNYIERPIRHLHEVFSIIWDFYLSTPVLTIAMAQNGDFISGATSTTGAKFYKRKAMNTFFCSTDRQFQFFGRINEDVNVYTTLGLRGELLLTTLSAAIIRRPTQQNAGGMSELYLDSGTYVKSFYSVMYCPSAVKIRPMGAYHKRLHHSISWDHCIPVIVPEKYRKVVD